MERYEIINNGATDEKDVMVKFIETVEIEKPAYSENQVLATIASLEQQKIEFCAAKDAEIEINNQMLLKIRAINRPINATE